MASPALSTRYTQVVSPSVPDASFHPMFASLDADVTLRSTQGTLYRVDSMVLRATSELFDTMFSLPQPYRDPSSSPFSEPLDVYEDDFVVECLLRIIHGFSIPEWQSLCSLNEVLHVAEKWDTPGPISALRQQFGAASRFVKEDPLRCYAIAKHFEWKEEARLASRHSLRLDLADPRHSAILDHLSPKDARSLLRLHQRRREVFKELLNSPHRFIAGNRYVFTLLLDRNPILNAFISARGQFHCARCGITEVSNSTWLELKRRMFQEIDRRPLGDTLVSALMSEGSGGWTEAMACWESRCFKSDCGALNYDRLTTLRQIQACLDVLPDAVED